jgi:hypothetical protein
LLQNPTADLDMRRRTFRDENDFGERTEGIKIGYQAKNQTYYSSSNQYVPPPDDGVQGNVPIQHRPHRA